MRPSGSPKALERRRFKAMNLLLKEGLQPVEVAKKLKVDRRSVRRWKAAFLKQGPEAIKAKPSPGRPPKLDKKARKELEKRLLQGAKAAGFQTDLWTCPRVAQLIQSCFGVRFHVDHIGRLLHSLGWSPQKPQRKAVERNEEQIQSWIKVAGPRIKKKPRA
ncbi:MAG: IS630 family transposase [Deltaproteobacteria bacterium]|nr:IS630 family transposase [Deltaproteobacteria bacterium]